MSSARLLLTSLLSLAACAPPGESPQGDALDAPSLRSVDGGTTRVTIRRDAYGVPHIEARTDRAALYGVGWVSAQDRLFQMQIAALSAQGRGGSES